MKANYFCGENPWESLMTPYVWFEIFCLARVEHFASATGQAETSASRMNFDRDETIKTSVVLWKTWLAAFHNYFVNVCHTHDLPLIYALISSNSPFSWGCSKQHPEPDELQPRDRPARHRLTPEIPKRSKDAEKSRQAPRGMHPLDPSKISRDIIKMTPIFITPSLLWTTLFSHCRMLSQFFNLFVLHPQIKWKQVLDGSPESVVQIS